MCNIITLNVIFGCVPRNWKGTAFNESPSRGKKVGIKICERRTKKEARPSSIGCVEWFFNEWRNHIKRVEYLRKAFTPAGPRVIGSFSRSRIDTEHRFRLLDPLLLALWTESNESQSFPATYSHNTLSLPPFPWQSPLTSILPPLPFSLYLPEIIWNSNGSVRILTIATDKMENIFFEPGFENYIEYSLEGYNGTNLRMDFNLVPREQLFKIFGSAIYPKRSRLSFKVSSIRMSTSGKNA